MIRTLLLMLVLALPAQAETPAKALFGAIAGPTGGKALALGSYAKGCMNGAEALPESGPTWQAMRLSRNRNWGTPELVAFIQRLSQAAARQPGWAGLYVGDMAQPRGGPMASGHSSHQIGLDVDVWLLPPRRLNLSRAEREAISSIDLQRASGAYVNGNWTRAHHEVLKAAASDKAVARIFIFAGAKVQMCKDETGDRAWLRKIRPWWGHNTHFHVRLTCPKGMAGCVNQDPPPQGDGCAEAQQWVDDILNPPPPDPNAPEVPPKRDLVLADLPKACSDIVSAR